MKFKLLNKLNNKEIESLFEYCNNEENMKKFVGKTYDNEKVQKIINLAHEDFKNKFKNLKFLYVVALKNDKVVGIGSIMPFFQDDNINRLNFSFDNNFLKSKQTKKQSKNKKDKSKNKSNDYKYENELIDILLNIHYKFIPDKALITLVSVKNDYYNKVFKQYELKKVLQINNNNYNVYQLL